PCLRFRGASRARTSRTGTGRIRWVRSSASLFEIDYLAKRGERDVRDLSVFLAILCAATIAACSSAAKSDLGGSEGKDGEVAQDGSPRPDTGSHADANTIEDAAVNEDAAPAA